MNLTPDPLLIFLQLLPFLALMGLLHVILWKPMLAYLHERERATVGAKKSAEELAARADARMADYEAALEKARNEVAEFRSARRAEAQKAHGEVVGAARKEADARIGAAVKQIQADAAVARGELDNIARGMAGELASEVLGRPVEA